MHKVPPVATQMGENWPMVVGHLTSPLVGIGGVGFVVDVRPLVLPAVVVVSLLILPFRLSADFLDDFMQL